MGISTVFENNQTQAVRLPKAVALPDDYMVDRAQPPEQEREGFLARLQVLDYDEHAAVHTGQVQSGGSQHGVVMSLGIGW